MSTVTSFVIKIYTLISKASINLINVIFPFHMYFTVRTGIAVFYSNLIPQFLVRINNTQSKVSPKVYTMSVNENSNILSKVFAYKTVLHELQRLPTIDSTLININNIITSIITLILTVIACIYADFSRFTSFILVSISILCLFVYLGYIFAILSIFRTIHSGIKQTDCTPDNFTQMFDSNSIEILINIINKNHDYLSTLLSLQILINLPTFKNEMIQCDILDCLLTICHHQISNNQMEVIVELLILILCVNNYYINTIHISKMLQLFSILLQHKANSNANIAENDYIERCLISVYRRLNKKNDRMKLFDGDIVIDGYQFIQNNKVNKQAFNSLVCGFHRKQTNKYVIPDDIANECIQFSDYGAFPIAQLKKLKPHIFLVKFINAVMTWNTRNVIRLLPVIRLIRCLTTEDLKFHPIFYTQIVPQLIPLLGRHIKCIELKLETLVIFTNICSGSDDHTQCIIDINLIPLFVNLMSSPVHDIKIQAIWTINNIAATNVNARNLVLRHGALSSLLPLFHLNIQTEYTQQQQALLGQATCALINFCRGKPSANWSYIKLVLNALCTMIKLDDEEILENSCNAFGFVTDFDYCGQPQIQLVHKIINNGILNRMIGLVGHSSPHIRYHALRTISNLIFAFDKRLVQYVVNLGVLKKLSHVLIYDTAKTKRATCLMISNIIAKSKEQIKCVIDAHLIMPLINILKNNEDLGLLNGALWVINNAISNGTDMQVMCLINQGVIKSLCRFFHPIMIMKSNKCLLVALEIIENILASGLRMCDDNNGNSLYAIYVKKAKIVDYLKQIQNEKAIHIIKTYFGL